MNQATGNQTSSILRRQGFTLIELLVSTAMAAILMSGLATTLFLASQAARFDSSIDNAWEAGTIIESMAHDLSIAQSFTEWTPTAVTFTVPDRNGDAVPETIRYSWSGIVEDPLVKELNGQSTIIADGVDQLDFSYVTRAF